MSDEIVFEDPFSKPKVKRQDNRPPQKHYPGEILRLKMGQKIECDCGKCQVDREGDRYIIRKGPMYHTRDGSSEWLVCASCKDRIKIHPIVEYMDANAKGIKE